MTPQAVTEQHSKLQSGVMTPAHGHTLQQNMAPDGTNLNTGAQTPAMSNVGGQSQLNFNDNKSVAGQSVANSKLGAMSLAASLNTQHKNTWGGQAYQRELTGSNRDRYGIDQIIKYAPGCSNLYGQPSDPYAQDVYRDMKDKHFEKNKEMRTQKMMEEIHKATAL